MDKNFLKVIMYLIICILAGSVVNESAQIFFLKNKSTNTSLAVTKIVSNKLSKLLSLFNNLNTGNFLLSIF